MIIPKDGLPRSPGSSGEVTQDVPFGSGRDSASQDRRSRFGRGVPRDLPESIGNFSIQECIGVGPRATVFRGFGQGSSAAIKVFEDVGSDYPDTALLDRFLRAPMRAGQSEERSLEIGQLRHPGLPVVIAVGQLADGRVYYARKYLRGDSLERVLEAFEFGMAENPHLSPLAPDIDGSPRRGFHRVLAELFADVATGIHRAHEAGIHHGHIHPANLIFSPSGSLIAVDFEGETRSIGTGPEMEMRRLYMAPERYCAASEEHSRAGDTAGDIYSLGAVLCHTILRKTPECLQQRVEGVQESNGLDVREIGLGPDESDLPVDFAAVIAKALASEPTQRYASALELAEDLRRLMDLEPTRAGTELSTESPASGESSFVVPSSRFSSPPPAMEDVGDVVEVVDEESVDQLATAEESAHEASDREDEKLLADSDEEARAMLLDTAVANDAEINAEMDAEHELETYDELDGGSDVDYFVDEYDDEVPVAETADVQFEELENPAIEARILNPGDGLGSDERALLYHVTQPTTTSESYGYGRKYLVSTTACFLVIVIALIWLAANLHSRGESYRSDGLRLGRNGDSITTAFSALMRDDLQQARESVANARAGSRDPERKRALDSVGTQLRILPTDPALARLQHPEPFVRLAALEQLRDEMDQGKRPGSDIRSVTRCLWDADAEVRSRAIEITSRAGAFDTLLHGFPIGETMPELRLDAQTFRAIYEGLARGSLASHLGAARVFDSITIDGLEGLDTFLREERAASPVHVARSSASVTPLVSFSELLKDRDEKNLSFPKLSTRPGHALAPNLVIEPSRDSTTGDEYSFFLRWVELHVDLDSEAVVEVASERGTDFFESQKNAMSLLLVALERTDTETSRTMLKDLVRSRYLDYGRKAVAALAQLGDVKTLLRLADEDLPLPLRLEALGKAVPHADDSELTLVARLLEIHPEPRIREVAFRGLTARRFFDQKPSSLVPALWDPLLRTQALEHLAGMPARGAGPALPTLLEMVRAGSTDLRLRVIEILGRSRAPELLFPLVRQLHETDPRVVRKTLKALADLGDDRAIPLAVGILFPPPSNRHLHAMVISLLNLPVEQRREDPAILSLAIQELFEYESPGSESLGLRALRRDALLARLRPGLEDLLEKIPSRFRNIGSSTTE